LLDGKSSFARDVPTAAISLARNASRSASPLCRNASVLFNKSSGFQNSGAHPARTNSSGRSRRERHPRVHAADEGLSDGFDVRSITRPFDRHVPAELHPPRHRIALGEVWAEHLRQPSLRAPPPEVHLKEAVLRLDESLREKEVGVALRVDVRYAPSITHDTHGIRELGGDEGSRDLRQRSDVPLWRLMAATDDRSQAQQDGCSN